MVRQLFGSSVCVVLVTCVALRCAGTVVGQDATIQSVDVSVPTATLLTHPSSEYVVLHQWVPYNFMLGNEILAQKIGRSVDFLTAPRVVAQSRAGDETSVTYQLLRSVPKNVGVWLFSASLFVGLAVAYVLCAVPFGIGTAVFVRKKGYRVGVTTMLALAPVGSAVAFMIPWRRQSDVVPIKQTQAAVAIGLSYISTLVFLGWFVAVQPSVSNFSNYVGLRAVILLCLLQMIVLLSAATLALTDVTTKMLTKQAWIATCIAGIVVVVACVSWCNGLVLAVCWLLMNIGLTVAVRLLGSKPTISQPTSE